MRVTDDEDLLSIEDRYSICVKIHYFNIWEEYLGRRFAEQFEGNQIDGNLD